MAKSNLRGRVDFSLQLISPSLREAKAGNQSRSLGARNRNRSHGEVLSLEWSDVFPSLFLIAPRIRVQE